jgi:hypothetical protein
LRVCVGGVGAEEQAIGHRDQHHSRGRSENLISVWSDRLGLPKPLGDWVRPLPRRVASFRAPLIASAFSKQVAILLTQIALEDLSAGVLRQRFGDLNVFGDLESGKVIAAIGNQRLG